MNKINYNDEMERILSLSSGAKILLHSCCAPCSSHCIDVISRYADVDIFYYNPNIFPRQEYIKRKTEQTRLLSEAFPKVRLIDCDYEADEFYRAVSGYESCKEGGERCAKCFYLRLYKTAEEAKRGGYDFFATTLTVSPHKNSPLINSIGYDIAALTGIDFLPSDFKKKEGYKRSIELSSQYNLYRQNYCGCEFSLAQKDKFCND